MKLNKLLKSILMPFLFHVTPETDEDGNVIGSGNNDRLKLYQSIADGNDKSRSEEFFEEDDQGNRSGLNLDELKHEDGEDDETEEDETTEQDEEDETTEQPENKTKNPDPSLTNEPRKYKIKVNGVEKEVDESWLIETAQKVDSADDYLRSAAKLNEDAKNLRKPTQQEETHSAVEEPDDAALARAIQMGSEEEAVAAIRKLRSPTGPSSDDLARSIDERLNFQTAVTWFKTEYKDIVEDPVLAALATQQDNMLRANGDKRAYADRFKDIGDGIRNWLKGKAPEPKEEVTPEPEVSDTTSKKQKKAAAPSVPKPAATKVKTPEPEEEEESTQDIIANMAKSRGGPQWMRN
jgi:hypothetical protein